MHPAHRQVPTIDQVRSGEAATLERAAAGFRDALEAERVYAGIVSSDGLLRFQGTAPVGAGSPGPMEPAAVPEIADAIATAMVRDISGARPPFNGDGRVVAIPWTAAGEVFGVGVVVMPQHVELPKNAVLALLGAKVGSAIAAMRDCDSLVHRVAQLHDSAAVLDQVMSACSDSMKLVDLDGNILRWNSASEELYGWSEPEVIGDKMPHVPESLRLRAIHDIRAIAASGRTVQRQSAAVTKEGRRISVEMTVVPFMDGEGNPAGVLSVGKEVKGLDTLREETEMCVLLADALAAPMSALVGYAQLLLHADILEDATRRKRTVRAIEAHTAAMASLAEDVALISSGSGPDSLDLERVDVSTLVTDAVGHFEQVHSGVHKFIIDYDSKVQPLMLDRRRMDRALQNMLSALLAERQDSAEVFITITPSSAGVHMEIGTSACPGMRASSPTYGTLGMHIARVIVESHGGALAVVTSGADTAFRIELPKATDARQSIKEEPNG